MMTKMPNEAGALRVIEAAGHKLSYDARGQVEMIEFGDTPCCGPQCQLCGDAWCLWERWLDVEECER